MSDAPVGSARELRRRLRTTPCPDCEHPWEEHPWEEHARPAEVEPGVCGECRFEEDHGQLVDGRGLCRNTVPSTMFLPRVR